MSRIPGPTYCVFECHNSLALPSASDLLALWNTIFKSASLLVHWQMVVQSLPKFQEVHGVHWAALVAGDAVAGADLLNQPVNERMLEQLLAGEWQVTGHSTLFVTPSCGLRVLREGNVSYSCVDILAELAWSGQLGQ